MAENSRSLEDEIADLIREHVTIGYTLGAGGMVDPNTIFVLTNAAAHMVVHRLRTPEAVG